MSKLLEILRSGRPPGFSGSGAVDEQSVFALAPKAFKEIENGTGRSSKDRPMSARDMAKYMGLGSVDKLKQIWKKTNPRAFTCLLVLLAFQMQAMAGLELSGGVNFIDGQTVHAQDLNNLIGNGTINVGFYSSQPIVTTAAASDYMLLYSPILNRYEKITAGNLVTFNPSIINGQPLGSINPGDLMLFYNTNTATLYNNTVQALLSSTLVTTFGVSTNYVATLPVTTDWVYSYTNGTFDGTTMSGGSNVLRTAMSVWQQGLGLSTTTNLPVSSAPTNSDSQVVWTTTDNTTFTAKRITREAVITNLTQLVLTNALNTNSAIQIPTNLFFEALSIGVTTNGQPTGTNVLGKYDLISIKNFLGINNYVSTNMTLPISGVITNANPFGVVPAFLRVVMVCVTNDANTGYTVGREFDISQASSSSANYFHAFNITCDSTSFYVQRANVGNLALIKLSDGTTYTGVSSTNNFKFKIYARQ